MEDKVKENESLAPEEWAYFKTRITSLETHLPSAEADKDATITVTQIVQRNLKESDCQVATLTQQRDDLDSSYKALEETNKKFGNELSLTKMALREKEIENKQLSNSIQEIEGDKVATFESGLLHAQRHVDSLASWDCIDWTKFKVTSSVQTPVLKYFLHPGKINDIVRKHMFDSKKNP